MQSDNGTNIQKILNLIIIFLVVVILIFLGYYFYGNRDSKVGTRINFSTSKDLILPALDTEFKFTSINNREFILKASSKKMIISGFENKLVFLKIFGWDCQYCKKEIPQLINLKNELNSSFEIIAIEAQQHSKEESLKYIKEYGINYTIIDGINEQRFYEYLKIHYGWSGLIPLTIVLGKGGKVLAYEVGAKSYNLSELMKASLARARKRIEE